MSDVATLGLAVDSTQVTSANKALDQLTTSSKNAANASNGLKQATDAAARAHGGLFTIVERRPDQSVSRIVRETENGVRITVQSPSVSPDMDFDALTDSEVMGLGR